MVVACVAGFGAWGASVSVTNGGTVYASELFGEGHSSPVYPDEMTPMVVLSIPANLPARAAVSDNPATTDTDESRDACAAVNHEGEADITFMLTGDAEFAGNVAGLMWDPIAGGTGDEGLRTATGQVASIKDGGLKGESSITITVKAVNAGITSAANNHTQRANLDGSWQDIKKCTVATGGPADQTIAFTLPRLQNLGALAGANALDDNPKNDDLSIRVSAESRVVSGGWTSDGVLTGTKGPAVINSRDAVTLEISKKNEMAVAIDGDAAFMSVEGANADGYVKLATITIETKPIMTAAKAKKPRELVGYLQEGNDDDITADEEIYLPGADETKAVPWTIYDLDGDTIDEGLRGVLMVQAMGTRDLFNDGDKLFIDYDKNKKSGSGEGLNMVGADMALSNAFSVDPDPNPESFNDAGTGTFDVYYMAGGKDTINHEAMINLTAMVHYSDPSAINETDAKTSTTLKFKGIGSPIKAYAIPHSTNGVGDKGNVRVRCESSAGCRVFLECWDDMGMRGFGEAGEIAGNNLVKWTGADVESVTGLEPGSRHSCRILSKGEVTVQQLTRDGNSGTLVNNTYVGEADM